MSGWSRTTKPSADTTIAAANVFGVDVGEVGATPGVAGAGWVKRTVIGSRVLYETLVAMKTPPSENNLGTYDDTEFKDFLITVTVNPANVTVANTGVATSLTVTATATPTANLSYQWERAVNANATFSNVPASNVYSGTTTSNLVLANTIGLEGYYYRVVVSSANAAANIAATSKTSTAATVLYS